MNINVNDLKMNLNLNKSTYFKKDNQQIGKEVNKNGEEKLKDKKSIQMKNIYQDMIKYYEERRNELKEYKENIKVQSMDEKSKKILLESIDLSLKEVEEQIQVVKDMERQKKIDEARKKQEEKQKEIKEREAKIEKLEQRDGIIVDESLKDLIKLDLSFDDIARLKDSKARLEVEKGYITLDGNANSFNSKQYDKISRGTIRLDSKIKSTIARLANESSEVKDKTIQDNIEDNQVENEESNEEIKEEI